MIEYGEWDQETDADGRIKRGLEWLSADGDYVPDDQISELFDNCSTYWDRWDRVEEMAKNIDA